MNQCQSLALWNG